MATEPEVVVVGAGAAGIAAARTLRGLGRSCLVLEASGRVGGRAYTEAESLGAPFDHGANWLHEAEANPLTPLARELGLSLLNHDGLGERRVLVGHRPATTAELAAYDAAWDAFEAAARARAVQGEPDLPVSAAVPYGGPWDATVAHWEGPIINAAELSRTSLLDWSATALGGSNLMPEAGFGALLVRLAEGLPVRTGHAVERIGWNTAHVTVAGAFGTLRARAGLVTVSTGVLAAGSIAFDPPLPGAVQDAVAGLPQGLLSKVALRLRPGETAGLPPFSRLERQVAREAEPAMTWIARPFGRDHLVGFLGGEAAWALAQEGPAAAEAHARTELARHLGAAEAARLTLPGALVTRWAEDPCFHGAYSHARPGSAGARTALRDAETGRLRFAGEACHPRYAGTVGGAWANGEEAAHALHAALRGPA